MRRIVDAYYSNDLKCWVRLERLEDGEWCHTSGYASREDAVRGWCDWGKFTPRRKEPND